MTDPVLFDPAVEHLLREAAADPASCLLRVPRPSVVKSLAHRQGVVRSTATGLSSVERELLRVHRAELAKLLREACVFRLANHPQAEFELSRHLTATKQTPVMSAVEWRAKAKYAVAETRTGNAALSGIALLDSCIAQDGLESASVAQLAIASMRLEPTNAARIYPAIELTLDGQEGLALRALSDVLGGACSRTYAAYAWTGIGRAHARRGALERSSDAYSMAARLDCTLIMPALSLLELACEIGTVDDILAAELVLDSRLGGASDAVTDRAVAVRGRRGSLASQLPQKRIPLLSKCRDQVGPTARMIINALI